MGKGRAVMDVIWVWDQLSFYLCSGCQLEWRRLRQSQYCICCKNRLNWAALAKAKDCAFNDPLCICWKHAVCCTHEFTELWANNFGIAPKVKLWAWWGNVVAQLIWSAAVLLFVQNLGGLCRKPMFSPQLDYNSRVRHTLFSWWSCLGMHAVSSSTKKHTKRSAH